MGRLCCCLCLAAKLGLWRHQHSRAVLSAKARHSALDGMLAFLTKHPTDMLSQGRTCSTAVSARMHSMPCKGHSNTPAAKVSQHIGLVTKTPTVAVELAAAAIGLSAVANGQTTEEVDAGARHEGIPQTLFRTTCVCINRKRYQAVVQVQSWGGLSHNSAVITVVMLAASRQS